MKYTIYLTRMSKIDESRQLMIIYASDQLEIDMDDNEHLHMISIMQTDDPTQIIHIPLA